MKTLLLTYDFPPMTSGIGNALYTIWRHLPAQDTFILAAHCFGAAAADAAAHPLRIRRYPDYIRVRGVKTVVAFFYALSIIFKERISVLACGTPLSMGIIGLLLKKTLGISYCVFYYGGEAAKYRRNIVINPVFRRIVGNAARVFANSSFSRDEVVSVFGADAAKALIVTPAVDTEVFRPGLDCTWLRAKWGITNDRVLLTVARLVKRKGIDAVIRALPMVKEEFPRLRYIVVGRGEDEVGLKALVGELGVTNQVIFAGSVFEKDLPLYYNLCDIYCMPNRITAGNEVVEGFGISFIEASACAKPVIAGVSGGVRDAVREQETGILCDPENTARLAQEIISLLKDSRRAQELGASGARRVAREFQPGQRAAMLTRIFAEIGATRGQR